MTIRASVTNLNDRSDDFSPAIFNDRRSNDIAFSEARFCESGTLLTVHIEGNF